MLFKNYIILAVTLLFLFPHKIIASEINLPSAGFDCSDYKSKFEFVFDIQIQIIINVNYVKIS